MVWIKSKNLISLSHFSFPTTQKVSHLEANTILVSHSDLVQLLRLLSQSMTCMFHILCWYISSAFSDRDSYLSWTPLINSEVEALFLGGLTLFILHYLKRRVVPIFLIFRETGSRTAPQAPECDGPRKRVSGVIQRSLITSICGKLLCYCISSSRCHLADQGRT